MELSVIVEIPKGSRNKYELDKKRNIIRLDRALFSAVHYPSDYGFIEETLAEDEDPLDALVLVWEPTFPGCQILAKPIGVFKMTDDKGLDEKILCVPFKDPNWSHMNSLSDVAPHYLKEIEHFFAVYKELEVKHIRIHGWFDREEAIEVIKRSQERYKATQLLGGA